MRSRSAHQMSRNEEGFASEALSSEVLKLKIDDVFQEVERLKQRVERLEELTGQTAPSGGPRPRGAERVMSDPDVS